MNSFFITALQAQCRLHPSFTPQDALKLCYQASFGAEHLLLDPQAAQQYFETEYQTLTSPKENEPLYEQISTQFCRVNLRKWNQLGLPALWLFGLFYQSTFANETTKQISETAAPNTPALVFHENLATIRTLCAQERLPFSCTVWDDALAAYLKNGVRAIHHSDAYRAAEQPAYRLVHTRFLPLLPLLLKLAALPAPAQNTAYVLAIDGRCGAGKTTLGQTLGVLLQTQVVQMDDFFLPPALRTPTRLAAPGGNVDYERFASEVLPHLGKAEAFSYQRFSCASMQLADTRTIAAAHWQIVEGSYSHHPYLKDYTDLRIFVTIDPTTQLTRIRARNGEAWAEDFKQKWIPMEEAYFTAFEIEASADIVVS